MIRLFTKQIERLGSEEGQALVFVAMVGLVIFLFVAMSMNLAELVNTKIKNQNVADAAALSGAAWQARALNMISGANQNIIIFWLALFAEELVTIAGAVGLASWLCNVSSPLEIPICIALLILTGIIATAFVAANMEGAWLTGDLQNTIPGIIDRDLIEMELEGDDENTGIVDMNYSFKENTETALTGTTIFLRDQNGDILDGLFRRAGFCELITSMAYYLLRMGIISEEDWNNTFRPEMLKVYTNGFCNPATDLFQALQGTVVDRFTRVLPLMLNTVARDRTVNNLEPLLPITVGTYREHYPPAILGTGASSADCRTELTGEEEDEPITFDCPETNHYSFATAHAFSESVNYFYHTAVAGLATPYPIPLIPFEMDWAPRLFPLEPYPEINTANTTWQSQWNDRGWEPRYDQLLGAVESPFGGWNAYCGAEGICLNGTLLDQLGMLFGSSEEDILRQNILTHEGGPYYFLY